MPPARRAALQELARVTRAAELLTELASNVALAVVAGAASVQPGAPADAAAALRERVQAQRPQLQQMFGMLSLAGFALAYAELSDAELAQYLEFLRSDAAQRFNDASFAALQAAMLAASAEFGRLLPGTRDGSNS